MYIIIDNVNYACDASVSVHRGNIHGLRIMYRVKLLGSYIHVYTCT